MDAQLAQMNVHLAILTIQLALVAMITISLMKVLVNVVVTDMDHQTNNAKLVIKGV